MKKSFSLSRSRMLRKRTAAALATAGALVMSSGLVMLAAPAATATNGNNGTVKIGGQSALEEGENDNPDNEPFVDCNLLIQWYNYTLPDGAEDSDVDATVDFQLWEPTVSGRSFTVDPDDQVSFSSFSDSQDPDFLKVYQLQISGPPMKAPGDKHGYHIKVTVDTEYSLGSEVKHKVFWYRPCEPGSEQVRTTESRSSCAGGYEERTKVVTKEYVWDDELGWVLEPEAGWTTTYDPDWHKVRDLTSQERATLGCDQPQNEVVGISGEEASCDLGYRSRTGTVTKEYVWNGNAWVLEPESGWVTVWDAWSAYRPLTDAEFAQLQCRPDQPDPEIAPLSDERMSCNDGVEGRSGTQTTSYVWNASTRQYDVVVGDPEWGPWEFVRNLTAQESLDLACIAGEETLVPSPDNKPKPDEEPTVLGTQAGVPTAVDAGLSGAPAVGPSTQSLLAHMMVAGGFLLLIAGGWLGLGRRENGAHQV